MLPYTIECSHCGETRLGRWKDEAGEVRPISDECGHCSREEYEVLVKRRDD